MDDRQFMQQALDCQRKLYRVALSMLRCDADAADAIQEAVFKGWLHPGRAARRRALRGVADAHTGQRVPQHTAPLEKARRTAGRGPGRIA